MGQEDINRTAVSQASIEALATAAVAGALFVGETHDLDMRPISPKANAFAQSMPVENKSSHLYPPAASIPVQPALAARARRMPRIDELPIPTQNEIRARGERFDSEPVKHLVTGRGVGGHDGEEPEPKPKPLLTEAKRPGMPGTEPRTSEPDSGNSRLLATEGLEMQGGSRPLAEEADDDELDIPDFLRRQPV